MARVANRFEDIWKFVTNYGDYDKCWEWTRGCATGGYGCFTVKNRLYKTHRIAYMLVKGDPGCLYVCHSCDNPKCCNPSHLWLGTTDDNMKDMVRKGRSAKGDRHSSKTHPERVARGDRNGRRKHPERFKFPTGENSPFAKLTDDNVREVLLCLHNGVPQKDIAIKFNVSRALICNIANGKHRKDVYDTVVSEFGIKPYIHKIPCIENFWEFVVNYGIANSCWEWEGPECAGYGRLFIRGESVLVHRIAYTLAKGEIPEGMIVWHTCANKKCCNPKHLMSSTYADKCKCRTGFKFSEIGEK